ncbi:hypothetical protein [Mycobacterium sp. TY815]|uniref:hypothetical protein n=1 Tax=Mycobacterium sp. TY815 TaxID=3050581 RepID=UPI002741868D|nr:hypothetical protein [Mycobacterium sp. TY815]MDP7707478.1 hypothetical protein [Mycobacterium sp. TY815]
MITDFLAAWLYTHPRARRVWMLSQLLWGGSLTAVATAPQAAAESLAGSLSFTGLHDSYGVPIGSMFISVLPMAEVVGAQGPQFSTSPDTWVPALTAAMQTTLTYTQLAGWLGLECAVFLFICSIGIWFIKFALGTIWLSWLAAVATPVVANVQAVVARMHLVAGGMVISLIVGGITCLTVGYGTGMGIIAGGLLVVLLASTLLRDPVGELVSDNGVLGVGRSIGFTLSQGVGYNGPLAGGGTSAQLDTLTSWLCDVLVRGVVQLISFGQVVDSIPGCATAFNQAIMSGMTSAPAQAMKNCAPTAYAHSQQLSMTTVGLFAIVIVMIAIVLLALDYIACEAFRIGFTAFWDALVIVPAVAAAMFPGPTRRFAKKAALRLLLHGAEMIAATAGLGIIVIMMARATRGTLPAATGMAVPLAMLLVVLLIAVFGAIGFRQMLHKFGDPGIPGPIRTAKAGLSTAFWTQRTLRTVDFYTSGKPRSRKMLAARPEKSAGQGQSEQGHTGQGAPGRQAHPPTAASTAPSRSSPAGTPRPPDPGRTSTDTDSSRYRKPAAQRQARPSHTDSQSTVGDVAHRAGASLAPEVAIPAAAATAAARRGKPTASSSAPGRTGPPTDRHLPGHGLSRAGAEDGQRRTPSDVSSAPALGRRPPAGGHKDTNK